MLAKENLPDIDGLFLSGEEQLVSYEIEREPREPTLLFNPQLNGITKKKSRDVTFHEKEVSHHFREIPSSIDMEVSLVYEPSLLDEHRESSVDPIKEPIEKLQGCSGLISHMSHITDSESSTYEEAAKHQVWKGAMVEDLQLIM